MTRLNREEIRECYDFAVQAVAGDYQQGNHFGQGNDKRTPEESIADKIIGKMGEYIFKKTLEGMFNNVRVGLNFNHIEGHNNLDNGDADIYVDGILQTSPYDLDVKTSSFKAQWLLIEETKFDVNGIYPFVKFAESVPSDSKLRENPHSILEFDTINGDFVGWATGTDFYSLVDNESICFRFNKDEKLYRPRYIPNDFRNYGVEDLRNQVQFIFNNEGERALSLRIGPRLDAMVNFGFPVKFLKSPNQCLNFYLGIEQ